jgi:hypothetical protein
MSQGSNFPKLFWRVVARAAPLVLMGLIMVNPHPDPKFTGMSKPLWGALTYLSLILLFIARPKTISALGNRILTGLKIAPGILLVYLVFIYRTTGANGQTTWLQPHYWGILGEIGWAYLGAGSIYLLFRGSPTALMGILGLLTALDIGCRHELLGWLSSWNVFRDIFGTHSAIITAGMMLGNLFVGKGKVSNRQRGLFIAVFGAGLYLAGTWLRPLYGINKNGATVSWGLVSSGICCGVYLFFYWIMEIMKSRQWAEKSLVPVGQNALLAYLFGDAVFDFFKVIFRHDMPYAGPYLNAVVQVLVVCAFAWTCTKNKIFMRL